MTFVRACAVDEVPTDEALAVTVGEYDVAVARQEQSDGTEFFAVQDVCSHAEVPLSEGEVTVEGGACTVECWLHGSRFDLRTGKPIGPPATEPVATFPVEVRDDPDGRHVYVDVTTTLNGVRPS